MNKKQLQSEETKARLMEAANSLFSQRGYHAASIEDISAATGTSKANIYYHFKSKEGLFLSLLDQHEAEWKELWADQRKRYSTVSELMHGIIEVGLPRGFQHPLNRAAREFLDEVFSKSEDGKRRIAEKTAENRRLFEELVQQGMDSGEFKTDNKIHLGYIIESLFHGLEVASRRMALDEALELYHAALDTLLYGMTVRK